MQRQEPRQGNGLPGQRVGSFGTVQCESKPYQLKMLEFLSVKREPTGLLGLKMQLDERDTNSIIPGIHFLKPAHL